jgi:hypothetical protein
MAATGNAYFVDPVGGSDTGHTGATTCPFKTITKALSFIGGNAPPGTTVQLLNSDPATNGEAYPIVVLADVTIETATTLSAPVTITLAAGKNGFTLNAASSGLTNLIIDGATNTSGSAVVVGPGAVPATTVVNHVTVQNTGAAGIVVNNAKATSVAYGATFGPALVVTKSGTATKVAPGMSVGGSGTAIIKGTDGTGHTSFNTNTQHGLFVNGTAFVTVNAGTTNVATAPGQATVDFDNNAVAGIWISQTPTGVTASQLNTISDAEITGITGGNGLHITGGSFVQLQGSYINGNHASGVILTTLGAGASANSSLSGIDLGTSTSPGNNTLQGAGNAQVNPVAGICLGIPITAGQTLNAAGNIFGAVNCATAGGALSHTVNCAAGSDTDIGGINGVGNTNAVVVSSCTLQ